MYFFSNNPAYHSHVLFVDAKGHHVTYKQWHDHAQALRTLLPSRSLVAILCHNTIGSAISYLSCLENRFVPILIDNEMDTTLMEALLEKYKPNYIFKPTTEITNEEKLYTLEDYTVCPYNSQPVTMYKELALLLTTSGSTGSPKLVRQSYENLQSNAASIAAYLHLTSQDYPISSLPMHYTFGLSVINSHVLVGAKEYLTEDTLFDASFWRDCKNQRVTSLAGVPFTYECLNRLRFTTMDLPDMKLLIQAGGKLSKRLQKVYGDFAATTNKRFVVMYGQTEATARMSYLPPEKCLEKIGSIGIAIPGGIFHIMDEQKQIITTPNIIGELCYDGPNVTLGYAKEQRDLQLGDERQGRLFTGDMAYVDNDGYYYITGRKKRFVKIMGKRVNMDEIEQLLKNAIAGYDFACAGEDDNLHLFTSAPSSQSYVIDEFITQKTGIHPSCLSIHTDYIIPKNSSGKTQYSLLSQTLKGREKE